MLNVGVMFGAIMAMVAMVLFVGFLLSWPLMLLWNGCLVPAVPSVHEVGWLQMWGIAILCSFLFKTTVSKKD
jgi:hypothetical protein